MLGELSKSFECLELAETEFEMLDCILVTIISLFGFVSDFSFFGL